MFLSHTSLEALRPMKIYGNFEGAYSLFSRTLWANLSLMLSLFRAYQSLADMLKHALAK